MASVLILGGTRDAVELAALLAAQGLDVTSSLAGVTTFPQKPIGKLRVGGFGGPEGLAAYACGFDLIADATHPFAARISAHAHAAAATLEIPYVRIDRPAWAPEPGDRWTLVAGIEAAAAAMPPGARILLTIGRKEIAPFLSRPDLGGVVRLIERPATEVPERWRILQARPPFSFEDERALLAHEAISMLVTKNAGGPLTHAKLLAARALAVPVVMVERPPKPECESAATPEHLAALVRRLLSV